MSLQETSATSGESIALTYFNDFQARTVEAIAERIIPGDSAHPGATQAGVVYYIDRAVSGFSTGLQRIYRLGIRELEAFCNREHSAAFVDLSAEQQDDVVRRFLGKETGGSGGTVYPAGLGQPAAEGKPMAERPEGEGAAPGGGGGIDFGLLRSFFAVVREHAVEGFFCDPVYGGNRGAVGWRLVGFPGAQWGYTAEQMKPGFDATVIPVKTLSDLRHDLKNPPDNAQYYRDEGK
jgi:gluconate 2-dehydrogenase gamma chain